MHRATDEERLSVSLRLDKVVYTTKPHTHTHSRCQSDEELTPVGVGTRVGHSQDASSGEVKVFVLLKRDMGRDISVQEWPSTSFVPAVGKRLSGETHKLVFKLATVYRGTTSTRPCRGWGAKIDDMDGPGQHSVSMVMMCARRLMPRSPVGSPPWIIKLTMTRWKSVPE